ncbi:V-type ATP synthase subunit K [Haploplasma modicum]|jgi:V/A-type H+/Na+-transporting ATPase subunit K|uniref:V-type ATP synthase subunit K n=1 Tax=Haploplasma modicum TaxID=2150 RepID=UPI00214CF49B|nr:V-type ATP synthase subunit K [Haploplasma modicum]MCR1808636.1 V-type ATP synthase subunit K [Haploplasma modicum]
MDQGLFIALIGIFLSTALAGAGSAIGVSIAGQAGTGVLSEKPELFGRVLILQALPGTQGIYGFLMSILLLQKVGLLGGAAVPVDTVMGWRYFAAAMPIAIVGLISAIYQGKAAAGAIMMTSKRPNMSASGMTMTALVETYAILALLVSILLYTSL